MAARENQGYLIAVIILVLLSLVLALVAFLGVQKAYERAESAEASEAKLQVSRKIADAEAIKGQIFKAIIGDLGPATSEIDSGLNDLQQISATPSMSDADKKIVDDIITEVRAAKEIYKIEISGQFANDDEADSTVATLRSRLTDLTALVDRLRKSYTIQVRRADEAQKDNEQKLAQAEDAVKSANDEVQALNEKLQDQKAKSLVNEQKLTDQVEKSKIAIADVTRKSEEAASVATASILQANNQVALLEEDNVNLKTKLNQLTNQVFDRADGKVIRVASALKTVFLDIGRGDGLTNNRTFSVYDQSVTNFETATPKGSIEVVQVGNFRSEARITNENPVNPILRGDHILTPTWDPGFSLKIALAGRFDLDGDRYDDTDKLVRLIERNGGEVVARHDEKGNVTGKLSPEVRYLVKGNEGLISSEDDADAGRILNALREMEADASKNTVQVIDLQKLLNLLGVSAQPKTQQLDFPPGGFVPRSPGAIREGSTTRDSGSTTRDSGSSTR